MLEEEFFLLGQPDVGAAEDGAEGGGHLQGDEQEDHAPDGKRTFLAPTSGEDDGFQKSQGEEHRDDPGPDRKCPHEAEGIGGFRENPDGRGEAE